MTPLTRRDFVRSSAALAAGALAFPSIARSAYARGSGAIRVGLIGSGGRGTGAATDLLAASPDAVIVAMGDALADRLEAAHASLTGHKDYAARVDLPRERCFLGLDAYKQVLACDVEAVILTTPPGFRPRHLAAAIDAGKHVFMEKPVAVDPVGVRMVLDASRRAADRGLNIVAGTQRRHEQCYLECMKRVHDGEIGDVLGAAVYWNQGGLWMHPRRPEWSDLEWQMRNWLYFTWLSGDHIVEQHVHNLDVAHWALAAAPLKCIASGGRQVRTGPEYGHVFDHFAVQFEYDDGRFVTSQCRQIDGCSGRVEEVIYGTRGRAVLASGRAQIRGEHPWRFESSQDSPYVCEHRALVAGITGGPYINEGERIAHSTLMAIMGRESAYTGKELSWERALHAELDLLPDVQSFGPLPCPPVAVPGKSVFG